MTASHARLDMLACELQNKRCTYSTHRLPASSRLRRARPWVRKSEPTRKLGPHSQPRHVSVERQGLSLRLSAARLRAALVSAAHVATRVIGARLGVLRENLPHSQSVPLLGCTSTITLRPAWLHPHHTAFKIRFEHASDMVR